MSTRTESGQQVVSTLAFIFEGLLKKDGAPNN
jgi:hypothetical protein